jgi:hypothetical protein
MKTDQKFGIELPHTVKRAFGIELPHTVKRALETDEETETTFWIDAIRNEMITVTPEFEFLDQGINAPAGHQKILCHVIFDVKMDFTRMARSQGAYLNAPCREKVYTICRTEFGEHVVKVAVIKLALYRLKSSGFA